MKDEKYISKLENVIKQMLTPLKDIPFNLVIESLTGKKVIPFDFNNPESSMILRCFATSCCPKFKSFES